MRTRSLRGSRPRPWARSLRRTPRPPRSFFPPSRPRPSTRTTPSFRLSNKARAKRGRGQHSLTYSHTHTHSRAKATDEPRRPRDRIPKTHAKRWITTSPARTDYLSEPPHTHADVGSLLACVHSSERGEARVLYRLHNTAAGACNTINQHTQHPTHPSAPALPA